MLLQKLLDEKTDDQDDRQAPMTGSDEKKDKSPRMGSGGKKRGSPN